MSMPRKVQCVVSAVTAHGGGVYTIDLKPCASVPAFAPGQFLHLTVDEYDPASFWPESRVFSIASSPKDRSQLRICYSVKGRYTRKMEQVLGPGLPVWVKLPYGDFVIDASRDAVLIAGGTGISAFTAFIEALAPSQPTPNPFQEGINARSCLALSPSVGSNASSCSPALPSSEGPGVGSGAPPKVTLLYGARTPDLWLFRDMIERQVAYCPSLKTVFFAEFGLPASPSATSRPPASLCFLSGRLSVDPLFGSVQSHQPFHVGSKSSIASGASMATVFYLSGPPAMLKTLGADLAEHGVPPGRIRMDAWE